MARPRKADAPTIWNITVPTSLHSFYAQVLADPITGQFAYGSRTELVSELLRQLKLAYTSGPEAASFEPVLAILRKHLPLNLEDL